MSEKYAQAYPGPGGGVVHPGKGCGGDRSGSEPFPEGHRTIRAGVLPGGVLPGPQLRNTLKTALVVGVSVAAVNRYLGLKDTYWDTPEYRERLSEIEKVGSQFWAYQDSKKKPGRKPRRRT